MNHENKCCHCCCPCFIICIPKCCPYPIKQGTPKGFYQQSQILLKGQQSPISYVNLKDRFS